MVSVTFHVGTDVADWRVVLQDVLENGTLSPSSGSTSVLTITDGARQIVLQSTSTVVANAREITSSTGFTSYV